MLEVIQDWLLLLSVRRVISDIFWSRESLTVLANFREVNREAKIKATFGLEDKILEQYGPFPFEDFWGVAEAWCAAWRLLDAGKKIQRVQFDTIWKIWTFQSNNAHAWTDRTGLVFMGIDGTSSRVYNSATNTVWFSRFIQGCHKKMGDLNLPDKAVDCYVIQRCF